MAGWTNTIHGFVQQRQRERLERMEREEIEKRKMDLTEYELKREERQQAIERATKIAYNQMDNVKAFNSKMMLSDVM